MAIFLLSSQALKSNLQETGTVEIPDLEASDSRDEYSISDGDGTWIRDYIAFLERVVRQRCALPGFAFVDDYRINEDLFDEIPSPHVRALLIEFTNQAYPGWMRDGVDLPDYEEIRSGCRTYCDDCEHAFEEIYGTYDGELPEDVEEDEDVDEAGISDEECEAREARNEARDAERNRRQAAKEEAECEVVDHEWACRDDCDGFMDHVDEQFRDAIGIDMDLLAQLWDQFLTERGEHDFPPLIVELARSANS